jgi:hypothetical protein
MCKKGEKTMETNCCYHCPNRKLGCHSVCEKYQAFLKENEIAKAKARQEASFRRYEHQVKFNELKRKDKLRKYVG